MNDKNQKTYIVIADLIRNLPVAFTFRLNNEIAGQARNDEYVI